MYILFFSLLRPMLETRSQVLVEVRRRSTHSVFSCSFFIASISGVHPFLSRIVVLAWQLATKYSTTSTFPRRAARCSGVCS